MTKHSMRLQASPFERMRSGTKTIEIRINDAKRQLLKCGDEIEFSLIHDPAQTLQTEIVRLDTFATFQELFAAYPPEEYGGNHEDEWDLMYQYYSPEEEAQYGVLAIILKSTGEMIHQEPSVAGLSPYIGGD